MIVLDMLSENEVLSYRMTAAYSMNPNKISMPVASPTKRVPFSFK
jgi:hypothetical protein